MPAVNNEIHIDLIRDALTARGLTGITFDAATYPDGTNAINPLNDLLLAIGDAQQAQNDVAIDGSDVQLVTRAVGAAETREYPPGSGTFVTVQPVSVSVSFAQQSTVTTTFPNLA